MKGNDALKATETLMSLNATSETRKSEYAAPRCEEESDNKYLDIIFRLLQRHAKISNSVPHTFERNEAPGAVCLETKVVYESDKLEHCFPE